MGCEFSAIRPGLIISAQAWHASQVLACFFEDPQRKERVRTETAGITDKSKDSQDYTNTTGI